MRKAIVIGAGVGGLTAALLLSKGGYDVTVLEKNDLVGGKMGVRSFGGCTFDSGPSLITMPFILDDLFKEVGVRMHDYLRLLPLENTCTYRWPDGTSFTAYSDHARLIEEFERFSPGSSAQYRAYMEHAGRVYHATKDVFLFNRFRGFLEFIVPKNIPMFADFSTLRFSQKLHDFNASFFRDPRLVQLFDRFATYNGSSPFKAPATLMVIPFIEFEFGGWYPEGGVYRIAKALEELCIQRGIKVRTMAPVEHIFLAGKKVAGVELSNGERLASDVVISNCDAWYTSGKLLKSRPRFDQPASCSGAIMMAPTKAADNDLAHHNIFFSRNYKREFDDIFARGQVPDDPTVYLSISSKTDRSQALPDRENRFYLINAPAALDTYRPTESTAEYYEKVQENLRATYGVESEPLAEPEFISPARFAELHNSRGGALYGAASHSMFSAFLRPGNRFPGIRGLYLCGGTAHPGGGVPLVVLSGRFAALSAIEDAL